ncbi:MAG TPA: TonB family protein [Mediterranea massiliensis]|uniref:TonB family protein n=1 Tax=Mediterranea massiliensis TaxID=1841865 RepID=A0A921HVZ1_9BACT|nr:M56 family metallopeptidase [Mediterranea massiliensis]HJF91905.1 TonB family protein [Mediterranea massiliensis]
MGTFLVYILKSAACLAVFYLFYKLLMSRDTFHRFNRFALLGLLVLSSVLPLVEVSVNRPAPVHETMLTLEQLLLLADVQAEGEVVSQPTTALWVRVSLLVYLAGIIFFAVRNLWSLGRLAVLLRRGRLEQLADWLPGRAENVRLVVHNHGIAPFSWMRYIVLSRKDLEENGREILIHELAHIRNRHSWDLLLADICIFVQWFNPAAWLLKQELQTLHEYEADDTVLREGVDAKKYQMLLIKKAVGTRLYSMANSFNHSSLKKRITMMLKEKSNPWARVKYLYVLPLAALAVSAFARPEVSAVADELSSAKVNDLVASMKTNQVETASVAVKDTLTPDESVFEVVEQMPEFPDGGMAGLMEYFKKNLRYPEEAKKAGTQGRVVVQFLINKNGAISDASVLRSVDRLLDAEAVRLVRSMPKWKPGMQKGKEVTVKYTVPVLFKLEDVVSEASDKKNDVIIVKGTHTDYADMLIVIDGQEVTPEILGALNPDRIHSFSILKEPADVAQYTTDESKKAVMLITLKKEEPKPLAGTVSTIRVSDSARKAQVVVDDKLVDESAFKSLSPDQFESITVLKPEEAVAIYGEAGKNGVIVVRTKAATSTKDGELKVSGRVVDPQGEPVIGACITIEGTTNGTVTDVDGKFTLTAPNGAMLKVGYVGMKEARLKASPILVVKLEKE